MNTRENNIEKNYEIQTVSQRVPIKDVIDYFDYIDELRAKIMKPGIDFDIIPGTVKPTLLKPGAEKLCFAFKLSPTYEVLESIEDHDKIITYKKYNKKTGQNEDVEALGFFYYKIICRLVHRDTGVVVAEQIGTCSSYDPGKGGAPANTVIKIAQKRAHVGATLSATFTSDRFTQDLEDYADAEKNESYNETQTARQLATEKQMGFISKLLQSSSVPEELKAEINAWAAGKYQYREDASLYIEKLRLIIGEKKADDYKPNGKGAIIQDVLAEEKRVIKGKWLNEAEIPESRMSYAGNTELENCSEAGLKNYLENLKSLKTGKE